MNSTGAVALNCRFTGSSQRTHTEIVAYTLFDQIIRLEGRNVPLVAFADPKYPGVAAWKELPNIALVEIPFSEWTERKRVLWEQFSLPGLCRKMGCEVAHHPLTTTPFLRRGVKNIVTIHDLDFLKHPERFSRAMRAAYSFIALPGLMRAWRVVAISEYVREEAAQRLGLEEERLWRVYNGIRFGVQEEAFAHSEIPYILSVGSLQPNKNLSRMLVAYRLLRQENPEIELWIAGLPDPGFTDIPEIRELLATEGVHLLGYLNDADLRAAYTNALVFCYPSIDEGSGVPILEAMACGTPVVASSTACYPEMAGGHAELVDPHSPHSIADGVLKVLARDPEEREERMGLAAAWAAGFNWRQTATSYLTIYQGTA